MSDGLMANLRSLFIGWILSFLIFIFSFGGTIYPIRYGFLRAENHFQLTLRLVVSRSLLYCSYRQY
jgi:hypothetical protein